MADTCFALKIAINEPHNIKIKIRLWDFSKIFRSVGTPIWLPQAKAFH